MKYSAFISYNSKDNNVAKRLQKHLENFTLPTVIVDEHGNKIESYTNNKKKFKIFRYVTDLVDTELNKGLERELDNSKSLIVLCSPNSAKSEWVGKEIRHFIESEKKNDIIPVIIAGTPYCNDENECLHYELIKEFPNNNLLGVDLNDTNDILPFFAERRAVAKIVSLIIDLPDLYDYIWNRYRYRLICKVITYIALLAMFISSLFIVESISSEFNSSIQLKENNINTRLPECRGKITVKIGNDIKTYEFKSIYDKINIPDIARKYYNKDFNLSFSAIGYKTIDTTLKLNKELIFNIERDEIYYGTIQFYIIDVDSNKPVQYCHINIQGKDYYSDKNGLIKTHIKLSEQQPSYCITSNDVIILQKKISPPFTESSIIEVKKHNH